MSDSIYQLTANDVSVELDDKEYSSIFIPRKISNGMLTIEIPASLLLKTLDEHVLKVNVTDQDGLTESIVFAFSLGSETTDTTSSSPAKEITSSAPATTTSTGASPNTSAGFLPLPVIPILVAIATCVEKRKNVSSG